MVYVGSFSKTLMPSLRVGYLIAPRSLQDTLRQAKLLTDWQGDAVTQGALARFMAEGLLSAHVRKVTKLYAGRRQALLDGLATLPPGRARGAALGCRPAPVHLLHRPHRRRRGRGQRPPRGPGWRSNRCRCGSRAPTPRPGLAMGFRRITVDQVPEAVARLAAVLPAPREAAPIEGLPARGCSVEGAQAPT